MSVCSPRRSVNTRGARRHFDDSPMKDGPDSWWAPVWRGLVVDPEGKHVRRLSKGGFALLIYMILHARRQTGFVARKQATIAKDMGLSERTIRASLRSLIRHGYIAVRRTGRAMQIYVLRWRPVGKRRAGSDQTGAFVPVRAEEDGREPPAQPGNHEQRRGDLGSGGTVNKSISTKDLLRKESVALAFGRGPSRNWRAAVEREDLLARDLADGLGDRQALPRYQGLARRYPEVLLRELMSEARAVPRDAIRRSRSAIFNHLLRQRLHGDLTDTRA